MYKNQNFVKNLKNSRVRSTDQLTSIALTMDMSYQLTFHRTRYQSYLTDFEDVTWARKGNRAAWNKRGIWTNIRFRKSLAGRCQHCEMRGPKEGAFRI